MKRTVSLVLSAVILVSTLLLSSCGLYLGWESGFPDGYTGGVGIQPGTHLQPYCLDNYDEVVEAIELLKSHGSTFGYSEIVRENAEGFDIKYVIIIDGSKADKIEYGENPYDRRAEDVSIYSYVMLEDVTVKELEYSNVMLYDHYRVMNSSDTESILNNPKFSKESLKIEYIAVQGEEHIYNVLYGDKRFVSITANDDETKELTDGDVKMIAASVEFLTAEGSVIKTK